MSEILPYTDVYKLFWNSLGTFPAVEPVLSKKQAGYDPGTGNDDGEVPSGDNFNWLLREVFLSTNWLADSMARTFEDIHDALLLAGGPGEVLEGFRFYVAADHAVLGRGHRFAEPVFSTSGTGSVAGNVLDMCGDGEQLYYLFGGVTNTIVAASPDDGAEIWEQASSVQKMAIAADGARVYYTKGGTAGLFTLNRETGAELGSGGAAQGSVSIAVNGVKGVGASAVGQIDQMVFWTLADNPTQDGTVNTGAGQLQVAAIDQQYGYFIGKRGTTVKKVFVYDLQTRTKYWDADMGAGSAVDPNMNGMAIVEKDNGNLLFIAHQRYDITGGGDWANLTMFDLNGLGEMAHFDIGGGVDALNVCYDGAHIYLTLASYAVLQLHPRDFSAVWRSSGSLGASRVATFCDGVSLYSTDGANGIKRDWTGQPNRAFQVANPADDNRPSWCYHLAIPAK